MSCRLRADRWSTVPIRLVMGSGFMKALARRESHHFGFAIFKVGKANHCEGTLIACGHFLKVFDDVCVQVVVAAEDLDDYMPTPFPLAVRGLFKVTGLPSTSTVLETPTRTPNRASRSSCWP